MSTGTGGRVVGLHRTPARKAPLEPLAEAVIGEDWGVEGDRHARPASSRQIVLTQSEVLDELGIAPGDTREQLTCSGLGVLGAGDVVVIGSVRLELVRPRVPCPVMDGIRPGLMDELRGRAGWCTRVLAGGVVRPGDEAAVERHGVGDPPWLADYLSALAAWEAAPPRAPGSDGWSTFAERFAHLIAWDERGATRIDTLAAGAPLHHREARRAGPGVDPDEAGCPSPCRSPFAIPGARASAPPSRPSTGASTSSSTASAATPWPTASSTGPPLWATTASSG